MAAICHHVGVKPIISKRVLMSQGWAVGGHGSASSSHFSAAAESTARRCESGVVPFRSKVLMKGHPTNPKIQ